MLLNSLWNSILFINSLHVKLLSWSFNFVRDFIEKNHDFTAFAKGTTMCKIMWLGVQNEGHLDTDEIRWNRFGESSSWCICHNLADSIPTSNDRSPNHLRCAVCSNWWCSANRSLLFHIYLTVKPVAIYQYHRFEAGLPINFIYLFYSILLHEKLKNQYSF